MVFSMMSTTACPVNVRMPILAGFVEGAAGPPADPGTQEARLPAKAATPGPWSTRRRDTLAATAGSFRFAIAEAPSGSPAAMDRGQTTDQSLRHTRRSGA